MNLRDDIVEVLELTSDRWRHDPAGRTADAILALPAVKAREAVIAAARAWVERFTGMDSLTAQDSARLVTAVAELDALEGQ